YGTKTAALSTTLFNDGKACGGCYQIVCDGTKVPQWCRRGTYITITATNLCPPNYNLPSDNGGWVGCRRSGGMRFTINGRDYFELVLISNVGGVGEISAAWVRGSRTNRWEAMSRNWGSNWQSLSFLNGQALSFRVQASNGRIRTALNVVPSNWRFGQSFKSNVQF
ncbi:unnamed protein product, partial [Linum tenue]